MSQQTIVATYHIETPDPDAALIAFCRGQSVGNPTLHSPYETETFLAHWEAQGTIHSTDQPGVFTATIRWPAENVEQEGVNFLLSLLLGGQCDIDLIHSCRLIKLDLSALEPWFPKPRYGIEGLREKLGIWTRPLLGGIIKPKIGLSPAQVATVCQQMADGGIDFIKDDELLSNQSWCPLAERVRLVTKALLPYHVLYAPCITGDGDTILQKAQIAQEAGATALHLNLWCGLGSFLMIRREIPLPLFFQKSGDKVWTTGPFAILPEVLYQLVHLIGCDIAHVGMFGGYLNETKETLHTRIQSLKTTLPSFSCGMTPLLAKEIAQEFGHDVMVTSGGWIHSQPEGIIAAVKRLRRELECAVSASAT